MGKFKIQRHGYIGLIVMLVGLFGDNLWDSSNQLVEFVFLGLAIGGFALAYDGIEKIKR